jgi:hypothetical protein
MGPFAVEDEPEEKRLGRPCEYTLEIGNRICAELEKGRSLLSVLKEDGMPARSTLVCWLARFPEFASQYAHATDLGWDVFAEKIVERATDVPPELANSRKLEIDAGKWLLSKRAARRYGDRLDVRQEISGAGGGPLQVDVLVNMLLTPANLERLDDVEVAAIRSAAAKLALPAPVIDAVATVAVVSGERGDGAGEFDDVEVTDERR